MSKSPKKQFTEVEVIDTSTDGLGICKAGERVYFIPHTVPGDVIDVEVWKARSKFFTGKAIHFHKYSDKRAEALCKHFGSCGGCKWQNMQYTWQLHYKQKQVYDALTRIGGFNVIGADDKRATLETDALLFYPILGSANVYEYRNKLDFSFSTKRWFTDSEIGSSEELDSNGLGFHVPRMFDRIIDIVECHLMRNLNNEIRNGIRSFANKEGLSYYTIKEHSGLLRGLILRTTTTGECMCTVIFGAEEAENIQKTLTYLKESFPAITSLLYVINTKANDTIFDLNIQTFHGSDFITEEMEGLKFRISAKSFYQTNPDQAYELYKVTREFAQLKSDDVVYDLYTGTGTIANFIARDVKKVIGVEYVAPAIDDAKINSQLNKITNTTFFAGDMKEVLTTEFIAKHGKPNVIITDPPRAGMDEKVCGKLLEIEAERIVYVSCNPATQARDLKILSEKYKVVRSRPVDMFPQTAHVENVVVLRLRSG